MRNSLNNEINIKRKDNKERAGSEKFALKILLLCKKLEFEEKIFSKYSQEIKETCENEVYIHRYRLGIKYQEEINNIYKFQETIFELENQIKEMEIEQGEEIMNKKTSYLQNISNAIKLEQEESLKALDKAGKWHQQQLAERDKKIQDLEEKINELTKEQKFHAKLEVAPK